MQKERQEKLEKEEEEKKKEKEKQESEETDCKMDEDSKPSEQSNETTDQTEGKENDDQKSNKTTDEDNNTKSEGDNLETPDETVNGTNNKKNNIVTRSKTGALTPKTSIVNDGKKKELGNGSKEEIEKSFIKEDGDSARLTRQKAFQIATGTHLYKLGMDNNFKSYSNQYSINQIALNKAQRNEERDKKRTLSHKFAVNQNVDFKWIGCVTGSKAMLTQTLRQTLLQLEGSIQAPFMHTNWPLLRKPWTTAVGSSQNPRDFARALIALQSCIRSVVFASVWHEQLGHVSLQRVTALEREEKKRLDKKEKKEKEDEEERNRLTYNFVKYTFGLKHQIYKQKGEEYRVHGQWGWLWISISRKYKFQDSRKMGLRVGPQKINVQVQDQVGLKVLTVDPSTYEFLLKEYNSSDSTDDSKTDIIKQEIKPDDSTQDEKNVEKQQDSKSLDENTIKDKSVEIKNDEEKPEIKSEPQVSKSNSKFYFLFSSNIY